MEWTVQDLGSVGELVGAIAVVATLAYLAVQVRHSKEATEANTRQMRGQAFVDMSQVVRDQLTWLRDNPQALEVITKAQDSWEGLNHDEQRMATLWNMDEATYHELAFVLWQEGALDEASYLVREKYFLSLLATSGRRTWWDNYLYLLDQRFIDRINSRLEQIDELGIRPMRENQPMYRPSSDTQ
jgi:hypothetical protein